MLHHDILTMQFCVDPPISDHRSPPGSTHEVITFSRESLSLLLILSSDCRCPPRSTKETIASTVLIVDPPRVDTVDRPPLHFEWLPGLSTQKEPGH